MNAKMYVLSTETIARRKIRQTPIARVVKVLSAADCWTYTTPDYIILGHT